MAEYLSLFTVVPLVGCGKQMQGGLEPVYANEVTLYDTYAMALYFDGGLGPKTGICKVQYILDDKSVTLDFWHGHGGKQHQFTFTPAHYADLKQLKKVTLETTVVDGHKHKLFVDPTSTRYRVPGAKPIPVPV